VKIKQKNIYLMFYFGKGVPPKTDFLDGGRERCNKIVK
jgi:hypothetical protein